MYLYHLTLQAPTHVAVAAAGCFSGSRHQEVVVSRGSSRVELLRIDPETGKLASISQLPLFCTLRSIAPFRLPGEEKDYLVLGTDAGQLAILSYDPGREQWEKVHQETFGRSGVRRTVPGEYVVSDPKGRAIMVVAVEKQKFVYIMNRDPSTSKLTISSPLEAHKSNVVVFSLVAVDVGYENPLFAALEVDTTAAVNGETVRAADLEKTVTFYEVDLGLNHVVRKWSEKTDRSANLLVAVPGGEDGPGGVLVCAEGRIAWHRMGHHSLSVPIPARTDAISTTPKRGVIICSGSLVRAKSVFFLLQSEEGDLFRLSLGHEKGQVHELTMQYFDSVPVASTIQVFRSGFLFVASEWASQRLYQVQSLGEQSLPRVTSASTEDEARFVPHRLANLALTDQLDNYAEMVESRAMNLGGEETAQIYSVQGRAYDSTFNIMRWGLSVTEVASSELPAEPTGIWTLKRSLSDAEDMYMVVSFKDSTVVLQVGETVEEATDTGFINSVPTLGTVQLSDNSYVQVHPRGVRQIRTDKRINEWNAPEGSSVKACAANGRQVAVYLDSRTIVYLEADLIGMLHEKKATLQLPDEVLCLALGPVPAGRQRSRFLAVGSLDQTVRVLSCDPEDCLEPQSLQALAAKPHSLLITEIGDADSDEAIMLGSLVLDVGLENGVYARLRLDGNSGSLADARTRFLGTVPVTLCRGLAEGKPAVLALSSRPWLSYSTHGQSHMSPLFHPALTSACPFSSSQCPSGIVAIFESTLRILMVENLGEKFNRHQVPLEHSPRELVFHPQSSLFAILQTDHRGYTPAQRASIEEAWHLDARNSSFEGGEREQAEAESEAREKWTHLSFQGKWSSCIHLFNPFSGATTASVRCEENETLLCAAFVTFHDRLDGVYLSVGVARNMSITPRQASDSAILLYLVNTQTGTLTLTHRTPVDGIPSCLAAFGGRLLAGVGGALRLYDIGKKRLLRKCETRIPTFLTCIQSQGWRIFVGDSQDSVLLFQYHSADNRFQLIADDTQLRTTSTIMMLDYDTVAGADRFGNFFVLRLPAAISEDLENEVTSGGVAAKRDHLYGAPYKLERLAEFHIGDTVTSLSKTSLVYGSRELLLYTTLAGGVGVMMPFTSRDEALLFQNLEMFQRQESPSAIAGRDHFAYRSSYVPVKSVIDGDLCETFYSLPGDRKHFVSQGLDKSPAELWKKIQDMRVTAGV